MFQFSREMPIFLEIWDIWMSITRWNNQRFVNDRLYRCGLVIFALHGNWIKVMWQNDIYVCKKVRKDRMSSRGKFSNANRSLRIDFLLLPCHHAVEQSFFRVNLKKEQVTINFSTLDGLRSHTNIISSFFLVSFKRDSVYVIYNKFAQLIVTALSKESPHHSATHHCNNYCKYKMNINKSQCYLLLIYPFLKENMFAIILNKKSNKIYWIRWYRKIILNNIRRLKFIRLRSSIV